MKAIVTTELKSVLTVGATGSGKSLGALARLVRLAIEGLCAIVLMDRHGTLAKLFALHLISMGMARRMLYDQLSNFNRILAVNVVEASLNPSPFKRVAENQRRIAGFRETLFSASQRSDEQNVHTMPTLEKYADVLCRLLMFRDVPLRPEEFEFVFRFKHPKCVDIALGCSNDEARYEWLELIHLAKSNSLNLLENRIGSTARLFRQVIVYPAFLYRCCGAFDLGRALLEKRIIIIDASDDGSVPLEVATAWFRALDVRMFHFLQSNLAITGEPCPVFCVWEESGAIQQLGPTERNMLREGRKFGFAANVIIQDWGGIPLETKKAVKPNTVIHEWYNPGEPELAYEAAEDLMYPQLNPYLVHDETYTERQLHDGFSYESRAGQSTTRGPDGSARITETETVVAVPQYRTIREKRTTYRALRDQIELKVGELLSMSPGWRQVREPGYVSTGPEYVEVPQHSFPEDIFPGLADSQLADAIAGSQSGPEFTTPVFSEVRWTQPATNGRDNGRENGTTTRMRKNATNGRKRF